MQFAQNGPDAIKYLEKAFDEKDTTRYSLILIECSMPMMDGLETKKRLMRLYEGIGMPEHCRPKIVATTCMTDPKIKQNIQ